MTDEANRAPSFRQESFICPFCEAFASQRWRSTEYSGTTNRVGVWVADCFACEASTLWLPVDANERTGTMIWPAELGGVAPHVDMPEAATGIYNEARSVARLSPRSASALLRLTLEVLLKGLYPDAGNLNNTIGAAAADGLSSKVINAMDVLRFNGNASIHEIQREDTPETVAALSRILNLVVDRLITEPRQIQAMHDELPEGVRAQIERRDKAEPD